MVNIDGQERSLLEVTLRNENAKQDADDTERAEYLVRVEWECAVSHFRTGVPREALARHVELPAP